MLRIELQLDKNGYIQDAKVSTTQGKMVDAPAGVIFVEPMSAADQAVLTGCLIEAQSFLSHVIAEVNRG